MRPRSSRCTPSHSSRREADALYLPLQGGGRLAQRAGRGSEFDPLPTASRSTSPFSRGGEERLRLGLQRITKSDPSEFQTIRCDPAHTLCPCDFFASVSCATTNIRHRILSSSHALASQLTEQGGEDVSSSDGPRAAHFGNVAQERVFRIVGCARPGIPADSLAMKAACRTAHAEARHHPIRLARKRADAASRNSPKAISSRRPDSACASLAP